MTVTDQLWLTDAQVATILAISKAKVQELTTLGKIPSIKYDRMRRYHIDDVRAFADQPRQAS